MVQMQRILGSFASQRGSNVDPTWIHVGPAAEAAEAKGDAEKLGDPMQSDWAFWHMTNPQTAVTNPHFRRIQSDGFVIAWGCRTRTLAILAYFGKPTFCRQCSHRWTNSQLVVSCLRPATDEKGQCLRLFVLVWNLCEQRSKAFQSIPKRYCYILLQFLPLKLAVASSFGSVERCWSSFTGTKRCKEDCHYQLWCGYVWGAFMKSSVDKTWPFWNPCFGIFAVQLVPTCSTQRLEESDQESERESSQWSKGP